MPISMSFDDPTCRCPACQKALTFLLDPAIANDRCPHCGCELWLLSNDGERTYAFCRLEFLDPNITTSTQAITVIILRLAQLGALAITDQQPALVALLKREELGSTGIGRGVAMPHAKLTDLDRVIGAFATFPAGVNFNSLDAALVQSVCLILSPSHSLGTHLRLLNAVSRRLRN